jgi:hypothetical protein
VNTFVNHAGHYGARPSQQHQQHQQHQHVSPRGAVVHSPSSMTKRIVTADVPHAESRGIGGGARRAPLAFRLTAPVLTTNKGARGHGVASAAAGSNLLLQTTTYYVSVPDDVVGAVVGKEGSNMKQIMDVSGATISVSSRGHFIEGTNDRLVTIEGSAMAVQTAYALLDDLVIENS